MFRHNGFVLRNHVPKKQKISILDEQLGHVEAMNEPRKYSESLASGMLIGYYPTNKGYCYQIKNVEIYHVPFELVRCDIYFFHQMLELCYYFLPLNVAAHDIFLLLRDVVTFSTEIQSSIQKKIILLRFLFYAGIYLENNLLDESLLYLLSDPIEVMLKKTVSVSEEQLERWLMACISMHPQKAQFKTLITRFDYA